MRRALSLWMPMFAVDRVRRLDRRPGGPPDGRAILLAATGARGQVVAHACEAARAAGVRSGMTLAQARALLPDMQPDRQGGLPHARVEPSTPERDAAALRALAAWARRLAPAVAPDEPDGLLMDVSGCERLFGGEEPMARAIAAGVASLGFRARAAVASTFACAWAVARYGKGGKTPCRIVPDGSERAALEPLPTRALRIDDATGEALAEVGIERIGQLLALPRSVLPSRFEGDLLLRLDQALGQAIETIDPARPPDPAHVERTFDGPTTQLEAIELTVRGLVEQLCDLLRARESGARRLDIRLLRAHETPIELRFPLSRASRDPKRLWSLIRPRLERVNMGFGVERIIAAAPAIARVPHEQLQCPGLDESMTAAQTGRAADELIDVLINRLGTGRVVRADLIDSHIPERAFRARSAVEQASAPPSSGDAPDPGDRPSLLIESPEPARVMALTPDGPVLGLHWRGRDVRIVSSLGPERIAHEWWRSAEPARDYFKAQDEHGRWLWVCRELETGRWAVHGAWA